MATSTQSPNGFSYAQAAKGPARAATSQTPSSKVTSGTATPATGTFSELAPNSNWADDVEANEGGEPVEPRKPDQEQKEQKEQKEQAKTVPVKESAVERTKSESRTQNASSGVSSPDLVATSSTTTADDSSTAPNGTSSSDTTWETKSQNSEPAWIAERKERQTTGHHEDGTSPAPASGSGSNKRGKKEAKEAKEPALTQPPQKPVVLHEAPPPSVNIWAKRLEDASKTKPAVPQPPKSTAPAPQPSNIKENARPKTERKKANSITSASREPESQGLDSKKVNDTQAKKTVNEPRTTARQTTKPGPDSMRAEPTGAAPGRAAQREAQSLPNLSTVAPPPVKDETSWPTPEIAQEKERKAAAAEKESEDADTDASAGGKARDKPKWTPLPVTPTIVWQTEEMNRPRGQGGERGGRGSTTARGRGGLRGGPTGSKGGERAAARNTEAENGTTGRGRSGTVDREAMPPPTKPLSASASREGNGSLPDAHQSAAAPAAEPRHTKSPSKSDFDKPDAKNFEPSQRHVSHDIRADVFRDGSEAVRDIPTKKGSFENKKESRSNHDTFGANGKEFNSRGKTRGGRGRGGRGEFTNGHQPSQSFTNGHTEYGAAPYGVPQSPSAFQSPRGSHQYGFAPQGRGGVWPRGGGPRSQSIPVEQIYGRPPVQTYYPGMYEYPGAMSMAPMPFSPMVDSNYVVDMVTNQLEYYFSLDNLLKDTFLRKNMDTQGFVFLDFIANFNRMKQLTADKDVIKFVCLKSESVEIRVGEDGKDRIRRRDGWEQFVLPKDQREVVAQTDGPQTLHRPEPVQLPYWPGHSMPAYRGPPSASLQGPRGSQDSGFAMNGGVMQFAPMATLADGAYGEIVNGEEHRGRAAKSPSGGNNGAPLLSDLTNGKNMDPDVFPDEHISSLTVVVKMNQPRAPPHHNAASRTFSNGSIDTRSVYSGIDKEKSTEEAQPVTNGETLTNGDKPHAASSRHASPSLGRSPEKTDAASELMLLWVKDKEIPQESLPQDAALEPYVQLRVKALDQRGQAATGACPYDLDVLYQFWSHFLIRNFNNKMYSEFKYFARDDAQERHSPVGLQNLVQFYAKALASSNTIRDHVVKDYVDLVKDEPSILNGQAHKQLRQAWRNGALNLKNRKKLADILDDGIKQSLEA